MKSEFIRTLLFIVPIILIQSCAQEDASVVASEFSQAELNSEGLGSNELSSAERVLYSEFNIQMTIRNLIDYIELSLPEADLKYASKVAEKFVVKALNIAPLWKQLKSMGLFPDSTMNDMV